MQTSKAAQGRINALAPPFHLRYWKWFRLAILTTLDAAIMTGCYWAAFVLRTDSLNMGAYAPVFFFTLPLLIVLHMGAFFVGGMYRQVWRFANIRSAILVGRCVLLGTISMVMTSFLLAVERMPPRSYRRPLPPDTPRHARTTRRPRT